MPDDPDDNTASDQPTTDDVLADPTDQIADDSDDTAPIVAEISASFVTQTGIGAAVVCAAHDPLGKSCGCFNTDEPDNGDPPPS